MQTVSNDFVAGKKVLLRYDIDVPIKQATSHNLPAGKAGPQVTEDFRLKAGLETLKLCLEHAQEVILMGHIGRPAGREVSELSVAPIYDWFCQHGLKSHIGSGKLKLLENLRFEEGEEKCDPQYAHQLAKLGDVYINEAFASYKKAASTTVLPTMLPSAAGLNFAKEIKYLTEVRKNPQKPLVAIMGGAKVEDKLPVIEVLSRIADVVLVGGKLVSEIHNQNLNLPEHVMVGKLNESGFDLALETVESWKNLIQGAKTIVWNGPIGVFEDPQNTQSEILAKLLLESQAQIIVGGGDTVSLLGSLSLIEKFQAKGFVSSGGGAMLKFLAEGSLPAVEALK